MGLHIQNLKGHLFSLDKDCVLPKSNKFSYPCIRKVRATAQDLRNPVAFKRKRREEKKREEGRTLSNLCYYLSSCDGVQP